MQGGDISNEVVPRIALVFENLIGLLPSKKDVAKFAMYRRLRQPSRATQVFVPNEPVAHRIWDVTWRLHLQVECLTYLGEAYVDPITEWIENENLPVTRVWHSEPNRLARQIAHMPYLAAIYDPDPSHRFTYGSKGRIISPAQPDLLGVL